MRVPQGFDQPIYQSQFSVEFQIQPLECNAIQIGQISGHRELRVEFEQRAPGLSQKMKEFACG